MAASTTLKSLITQFPLFKSTLHSPSIRHLSAAAANLSNPSSQSNSDDASSSFTFSSNEPENDTNNNHNHQIKETKNNEILVKPPKSKHGSDSVTMPMSFMTGSIAGKRFYKTVTTREADDGNGWTVMLDYRTLKSPSRKVLKLPTLSLAKAIAAEWEYQETDGIRPFTMPLMRLACTAQERVPITRHKIIDLLVSKVNHDLVFQRAPSDNDITLGVLERQKEKIDPLLNWVESEFRFKPKVYSTFFGGKQEDGLVKAVETLLKKTDDCELATLDALTSAAHSLVIAIGLLRGRLGIEEAIELVRLEEDTQVNRWGLVEGGHDIDIADLKVSAEVKNGVFVGAGNGNEKDAHFVVASKWVGFDENYFNKMEQEPVSTAWDIGNSSQLFKCNLENDEMHKEAMIA